MRRPRRWPKGWLMGWPDMGWRADAHLAPGAAVGLLTIHRMHGWRRRPIALIAGAQGVELGTLLSGQRDARKQLVEAWRWTERPTSLR